MFQGCGRPRPLAGGEAESTAVSAFLRLPAPSAIPAATARNPAGKARRRQSLTATKPTKRWDAAPKAASFIRLPQQPRLHPRLPNRSMNKGGRLRATDSQVDADTKGGREAVQRGADCCPQQPHHTSRSDAALALMPAHRFTGQSPMLLTPQEGKWVIRSKKFPTGSQGRRL